MQVVWHVKHEEDNWLNEKQKNPGSAFVVDIIAGYQFLRGCVAPATSHKNIPTTSKCIELRTL